MELLGRSWNVEARIGAALDEQETQIRQLTEQQFKLLDFLGSRRRALIRGCAGSGKTMIASEKARRLSAAGFRVLFTCFNANLANWAAGQLARCGVEVKHFHRLCFEFAKEAGIGLEQRTGESVRPRGLPAAGGRGAGGDFHHPEAPIRASVRARAPSALRRRFL